MVWGYGCMSVLCDDNDGMFGVTLRDGGLGLRSITLGMPIGMMMYHLPLCKVGTLLVLPSWKGSSDGFERDSRDAWSA